MGKKTRKEIKEERQKNGGYSSEDDDTLSSVSSTVSSINVLETYGDSFRDSIENLTEKASATRIEALESITKILQKHYSIDLLYNNLESLSSGAMFCCQKATTSNELQLSFNVFSLLSVTLGGSKQPTDTFTRSLNASHSDTIYLSIETANKMKDLLLQYADAAYGKSTEVRCDAIFNYAIMQFMDNSPEDLLIESENNVLNILMNNYWKDKDDEVVASSINAWSILASMIPANYIVSMLFSRVKDVLKNKMMNTNSLNIKLAVGQAFALLFEACHQLDVIDDVISSSDLDDIIGEMNEIANISGKSISKKEKASQRGAYRDYLETVQHGVSPIEKINVSGFTLSFESWNRLIQYHSFKKLLKGGLLTHLKYNHSVQEIFGVGDLALASENSNIKLDANYKKMFLSKNSQFDKLDTLQKNKLTRQFSSFVHQE
ncbi:hypothetical protein ABK040_006753 [Willaertia magna]